VLTLPELPSSCHALHEAVDDVSLDVARATPRRLVPLAGAVQTAELRERLLTLAEMLPPSTRAIDHLELDPEPAVRNAARAVRREQA
jgi:hypothetical protein